MHNTPHYLNNEHIATGSVKIIFYSECIQAGVVFNKICFLINYIWALRGEIIQP